MARMRTRKPISPVEILTALNATEHDVDRAAALLDVSPRTLYRRMSEYRIKRTDPRYEVGEEAA